MLETHFKAYISERYPEYLPLAKELFSRYLHKFEVLTSERGFCFYELNKKAKTATILDVYITPENRRKGFGSKFYREVQEIAQKQGITDIIAYSELAGNSEAQKLGQLAMLANGFIPRKQDNHQIVYYKKVAV